MAKQKGIRHLPEEKQVDILSKSQSRDDGSTRWNSIAKEEVAATAPYGVPAVRPGSIVGDGIRHIDERWQETRDRERRDSRHIEFLKMCPAREPSKVEGHGEWEKLVRRADEIADVKRRASNPKTRDKTLITFLHRMMNVSIDDASGLLLTFGRAEVVEMLLALAAEADEKLQVWADSITRREQARVEKALQKRKQEDTRSYTAQVVARQSAYKASVQAARASYEEAAQGPKLDTWQERLAAVKGK